MKIALAGQPPTRVQTPALWLMRGPAWETWAGPESVCIFRDESEAILRKGRFSAWRLRALPAPLSWPCCGTPSDKRIGQRILKSRILPNTCPAGLSAAHFPARRPRAWTAENSCRGRCCWARARWSPAAASREDPPGRRRPQALRGPREFPSSGRAWPGFPPPIPSPRPDSPPISSMQPRGPAAAS